MHMRLSRVRFTVRNLVIVVAVVAIAIGAEMTRRRWVSYRKQAAEFAKLEQGMLWTAGRREAEVARREREVEELKEKAKRVEGYPDYSRNSERIADAMTQRTTMITDEAAHLRQRAAVYSKLKEKYSHAARYPWLPVEPDPPEPE
jgi:hypothetical protein